jgi:hypothetical protein
MVRIQVLDHEESGRKVSGEICEYPTESRESASRGGQSHDIKGRWGGLSRHDVRPSSPMGPTFCRALPALEAS